MTLLQADPFEVIIMKALADARLIDCTPDRLLSGLKLMIAKLEDAQEALEDYIADTGGEDPAA